MVGTFNSFTGFHMNRRPTRRCSYVYGFQFLHRIPLGADYQRVDYVDGYFQFLHRIPQRVDEARPVLLFNSLSIPSPDSTGFHKHPWVGSLGLELGLSIPSPDSTYDFMALVDSICRELLFQFLHRIPLELDLTVGRSDTPLFFQFLHRIPRGRRSDRHF